MSMYASSQTIHSILKIQVQCDDEITQKMNITIKIENMIIEAIVIHFFFGDEEAK